MLLNSTPSTARRDLSIARYAVVPLSPNSGLIGGASTRPLLGLIM